MIRSCVTLLAKIVSHLSKHYTNICEFIYNLDVRSYGHLMCHAFERKCPPTHPHYNIKLLCQCSEKRKLRRHHEYFMFSEWPCQRTHERQTSERQPNPPTHPHYNFKLLSQRSEKRKLRRHHEYFMFTERPCQRTHERHTSERPCQRTPERHAFGMPFVMLCAEANLSGHASALPKGMPSACLL